MRPSESGAGQAVPAPGGDLPTAAELLAGEMEVVGRITGSSNATFLVSVNGHRAIYKPVAGEKPLWDFPEGTLAAREHATWLLAEAAGWHVVPPTVLRDGPYGPGSLQAWIEDGEVHPAVDLVPHGHHKEGWVSVLSGEDAEGRPVDVVHSTQPSLRTLALLDVVVNNSDRKGGHVLTQGTPDDIRAFGIDHGLTFHHEPKLRTVLWGWIGDPLCTEERDALEVLLSRLGTSDAHAPGTELAAALGALLSSEEVAATRDRIATLLLRGVFPEPDDGWPSVPWPAF